MVELKNSHKITGIAWIDIPLVAFASFGFWNIFLVFILQEKTLWFNFLIRFSTAITISTTLIYASCYLLIDLAEKQMKKNDEQD